MTSINFPVSVGEIVYFVYPIDNDDGSHEYVIDQGVVSNVSYDGKTIWLSVNYDSGLRYYHTEQDIDKTVFTCADAAKLYKNTMNEKWPAKQIADLKPGKEFKLGDETFIVLEHTDDGTKVIAKDIMYCGSPFGGCNDWTKSPIRTKLLGQEYYEKICKIVGKDNVIPMTRDLTSTDGLDDFGTCTDVISMLTFAEYVKYHKILGLKVDYPDWWWLITPYSTPSNNHTRSSCCIHEDGTVVWTHCRNCNSVRPVFTLKS